MNTRKGRSAMLEKISGVITARIHDENDQNDEKGFTLIELLIVVVVLGILAAVTVFGLSGSASQSAQSACKTDVRTVEVAVEAFHANSVTGAWPILNTDLTNAGAPSGPYLRTIPVSSHYDIKPDPAGNGHVLVDNHVPGLGFQDYDASLNGGTNLCDAVK
jgi:general secretion pathway protein G